MAKKQKYCISIEDVREARIEFEIASSNARRLSYAFLVNHRKHTHTYTGAHVFFLEEQSGMNLFFKCELFRKRGRSRFEERRTRVSRSPTEQAKVSPHTLYHQRSTNTNISNNNREDSSHIPVEITHKPWPRGEIERCASTHCNAEQCTDT